MWSVAKTLGKALVVAGASGAALYVGGTKLLDDAERLNGTLGALREEQMVDQQM